MEAGISRPPFCLPEKSFFQEGRAAAPLIGRKLGMRIAEISCIFLCKKTYSSLLKSSENAGAKPLSAKRNWENKN
jgi:hypothetical protein